MAQSLFSNQWHRVAKLKPRLREAVTIKRQQWRKQLWYLIVDEMSGRQHRINTNAYQFIGRCDGSLSVQQIWDALLLNEADEAPTQDEVVELLVQFNQSELLQYEHKTDTDGLFDRRNQRSKEKQRHNFNPFMIKMPIGDPSSWLNKLDKIAHLFFHPMAFAIWFATITLAIMSAGTDWNTISAHASTHMLTPRFLILMLVFYPIIKALHELSHGLAIRHWGGEVHQFGISLLVFVPAPYVDATAANSFSLKYQRMIVSAAGIMSETFLAAIAFFIWANIQPGMIKDISFVTMVIGTVSTVLFNANPLLRFDGYYVLADFLDIPNLASRSSQFWDEKLKSMVSKKEVKSLDLAPGEKKWLFAYAPLSFAYRIFISIIIVSWLGAKWFLLGLIAALYMGFSMLIHPIYRWVSQLISSAMPGYELHHIRRNLNILGIVFLLFLFVIPLPFSTVAPAITWLPEQAQIRPKENGFIKTLPIKNGQMVKKGDLIAVIENPKLNKKRKKLKSVLDGLYADQYQVLIRNPAKAQNILQKINSVKSELKHINEKIKHLNIVAQIDGKLVMPKQQDMIGSYVLQGKNMGYVFEETHIRIRTAVAEKDAHFVRNKSNGIHVWLVENPNISHSVKMLMDTPSATKTLPSPALGDTAGGDYMTDPADENGVKLLSPVFLFDLTLSDSVMERIGGSAYVRFEHDALPLAIQLYQRANQLFLTTFSPAR